MSNEQPKISEMIAGLIGLAIICMSIAVYFSVSNDSSTEVESLKAQIVAKDKQLVAGRNMFISSAAEYIEKNGSDLNENSRAYALAMMMTGYDQSLTCQGGGVCEGMAAIQPQTEQNK
ncbi:hypothetical protein [Crenothrix sp.]|uniref:hypothetical protein n=1 Tax=Crenothrix sp. TaxID=3100433 RepID=UPI00374D0063